MYSRIGFLFWTWLIICIIHNTTQCLAGNDTKQFKENVSTMQDSSTTDNWFAEDKGSHLIGSLFITTLSGKISFYTQGVSRTDSRIIGGGISLTFGLGKEIYDSTQKNNRFSWYDLSADILGIILGMIILGIK